MAAIPVPPPQAGAAPRRTIPFDYSFTFELRGEPERIAVAKVEVSVEGAFIATSIGYGFRPRTGRIVFGGERKDFSIPGGGAAPRAPSEAFAASAPPDETAAVSLDRISLQSVLRLAARRLGELQERRRQRGEGARDFPELAGDAVAAVFETGFRLNPEIARQVLLGGPSNAIDDSLLPRLFEIVGPPPEEIQFLYAISDAGSGREFQSEPILNTAGLGDPHGVRPFRQFAVPIVFEPRTTIRMQVTELQTTKGVLHVSLHGYKVLGGEGTPTGARAESAASEVIPAGARRARR
ncbi:MAG: hypothetical protein RMK33_00110 [Arcobacter sp.]|nr:hypothetical protein [Bryobacteraceae bacterium]MDW8434550.1 hypothetical protein [Arcobacter sp.]